MAGKQNNGISVTTSSVSATAITAIAAHTAIAAVGDGYGVFAQSSSDGGNAGVFGYATSCHGTTVSGVHRDGPQPGRHRGLGDLGVGDRD